MPFCSNCGKPFRDDEKFCSNCGAPRPDQQGQPNAAPPVSTQPVQPGGKRPLGLWVYLVLALGFGITGFFLGIAVVSDPNSTSAAAFLMVLGIVSLATAIGIFGRRGWTGWAAILTSVLFAAFGVLLTPGSNASGYVLATLFILYAAALLLGFRTRRGRQFIGLK